MVLRPILSCKCYHSQTLPADLSDFQIQKLSVKNEFIDCNWIFTQWSVDRAERKFHPTETFSNPLDTTISLIHYRKIGDPFSLAHHLVSIYGFSYVLTLNIMPYFANFRLLAECSTPLVNIR